MEIKKLEIHFILKIFLIENECNTAMVLARQPWFLHSRSIKKIFKDKLDLTLSCFHVKICDNDPQKSSMTKIMLGAVHYLHNNNSVAAEAYTLFTEVLNA